MSSLRPGSATPQGAVVDHVRAHSSGSRYDDRRSAPEQWHSRSTSGDSYRPDESYSNRNFMDRAHPQQLNQPVAGPSNSAPQRGMYDHRRDSSNGSQVSRRGEASGQRSREPTFNDAHSRQSSAGSRPSEISAQPMRHALPDRPAKIHTQSNVEAVSLSAMGQPDSRNFEHAPKGPRQTPNASYSPRPPKGQKKGKQGQFNGPQGNRPKKDQGKAAPTGRTPLPPQESITTGGGLGHGSNGHFPSNTSKLVPTFPKKPFDRTYQAHIDHTVRAKQGLPPALYTKLPDGKAAIPRPGLASKQAHQLRNQKKQNRPAGGPSAGPSAGPGTFRFTVDFSNVKPEEAPLSEDEQDEPHSEEAVEDSLHDGEHGRIDRDGDDFGRADTAGSLDHITHGHGHGEEDETSEEEEVVEIDRPPRPPPEWIHIDDDEEDEQFLRAPGTNCNSPGSDRGADRAGPPNTSAGPSTGNIRGRERYSESPSPPRKKPKAKFAPKSVQQVNADIARIGPTEYEKRKLALEQMQAQRARDVAIADAGYRAVEAAEAAEAAQLRKARAKQHADLQEAAKRRIEANKQNKVKQKVAGAVARGREMRVNDAMMAAQRAKEAETEEKKEGLRMENERKRAAAIASNAKANSESAFKEIGVYKEEASKTAIVIGTKEPGHQTASREAESDKRSLQTASNGDATRKRPRVSSPDFSTPSTPPVSGATLVPSPVAALSTSSGSMPKRSQSADAGADSETGPRGKDANRDIKPSANELAGLAMASSSSLMANNALRPPRRRRLPPPDTQPAVPEGQPSREGVDCIMLEDIPAALRPNPPTEEIRELRRMYSRRVLAPKWRAEGKRIIKPYWRDDGLAIWWRRIVLPKEGDGPIEIDQEQGHEERDNDAVVSSKESSDPEDKIDAQNAPTPATGSKNPAQAGSLLDAGSASDQLAVHANESARIHGEKATSSTTTDATAIKSTSTSIQARWVAEGHPALRSASAIERQSLPAIFASDEAGGLDLMAEDDQLTDELDSDPDVKTEQVTSTVLPLYRYKGKDKAKSSDISPRRDETASSGSALPSMTLLDPQSTFGSSSLARCESVSQPSSIAAQDQDRIANMDPSAEAAQISTGNSSNSSIGIIVRPLLRDGSARFASSTPPIGGDLDRHQRSLASVDDATSTRLSAAPLGHRQSRSHSGAAYYSPLNATSHLGRSLSPHPGSDASAATRSTPPLRRETLTSKTKELHMAYVNELRTLYMDLQLEIARLTRGDFDPHCSKLANLRAEADDALALYEKAVHGSSDASRHGPG